VSGLAIVDPPAIDCVWEGFFKFEGCRSTYPDFYELSFIDEKLKIVPSSSYKNLCANGGLETTTFLGKTDQIFLIKFKFGASFGGIPSEECWIEVEIRASNPSGGSIMA